LPKNPEKPETHGFGLKTRPSGTFRIAMRTIAITARTASSNLKIVRIRIEELIDLVLFDRALHGSLVDVVDLNAYRVRLRGRVALRWKDSRCETSGTHIRRKTVNAIFKHVSLRASNASNTFMIGF
jgi:hypothetical protein